MVGPRSVEVVGRYAVYDKIASGGMASVHFGRLVGSVGFSRTVAIKRLHAHLADDPQFLSTMIDEARLAARIHHPNVVPTLDVVRTGGTLLIVMEYVRGESLASLLRSELSRSRRVPLPIASAILVGALHGLHAAHEATSDRGEPLDIVHRDISPQNILVGVDGVARVIDFGVAKAADRLQTTREGTLKGKMAYMAPEQLLGLHVTRRVDVFAMGIVLWEMLAGRRLFQADSEAALVAVVMAGARVPPSHHVAGIPPELDALVMRALAPDRAQRFESAQAMAEALFALVPPAFPAEVGRWVERAAAESLAKRDALLAEIESGSGALNLPDAESPEAALVEAPTRNDPSNLAVETRSEGRSPARAQRARLFVAGGAAVVLAVALFGIVRLGSRAPSSDAGAVPSVTPPAPLVLAPPQPFAAPDAMAAAPIVSGDLSPAPAATSSARPSVRPGGGHPSRSRVANPPASSTPSAASSTPPLHFTQPD
jgi:serine/threonine-protein kinase